MKYLKAILFILWGAGIYLVTPILYSPNPDAFYNKGWFITCAWISPIVLGVIVLLKNKNLPINEAFGNSILPAAIIYGLVLASAIVHIGIAVFFLR